MSMCTVYTCICMCICICTYIYIYVCPCPCITMSVCMFIYIYTSERPHELAVIVIECICNRSGRRHMYISITM